MSLLRVLLLMQGAWASVDYRFARWAHQRSGPARRAAKLVSVVIHKWVETTAGISISPGARIDAGLYIGHFGGIIVGPDVTIGERCNLSQGVTLGISKGGNPTIGKRVYIAPGAKVFGAINIGDDVTIGANAVVTKDVPAGATAVGVPARVVGDD